MSKCQSVSVHGGKCCILKEHGTDSLHEDKDGTRWVDVSFPQKMKMEDVKVVISFSRPNIVIGCVSIGGMVVHDAR